MDQVLNFFFSFEGRIGRRLWSAGALALLIAAAVGLWLFNEDSFDESANAISSAPTMAAFLWAALCLFAFTAMCAKRLNDRGRHRWVLYTIVVPAVGLLIGWGLGAIHAPFGFDLESAAVAAFAMVMLPAIVDCAVPS